MRRSKASLLAISGALLATVGFVWGAFFAGVPYQDPTPQQQESFAFHSSVSFILFCSGLALLLVGVMLYAVDRWRSRNRSQPRLPS